MLKKKSAKIKSDTLLDTVDDYMEQNELQPFSNTNVDKEYLQLPRDLEDVPSNELGRYLNHLSQQRIWVRSMLSRAEVLLYELEEKLAREKSRIFSPLPVKMSITEKELKLYEDPITNKLLEEMRPFHAKKRTLKDYMQSLDDSIFVISREVTRRESDFNNTRRVDSVDRKRR